MFSIEIIDILAPALIVGIIISLIHIPLGIEVLKRGIIFLDLAIAQFAALGMIFFHSFIKHLHIASHYEIIGSLIFGLIFSISCAISLQYFEKKSKKYQEAIIGCAFIFSASLSILLISSDPNSDEQMNDILSGQILWTSWNDLIFYSPIFLIISMISLYFNKYRNKIFYILFAITIPFSVNIIGVYLVFASLIIPALATVNIGTRRYISAYLISVISFMIGLLTSYIFDTPSGPTIIISMFAIGLIFYNITNYRKAI